MEKPSTSSEASPPKRPIDEIKETTEEILRQSQQIRDSFSDADKAIEATEERFEATKGSLSEWKDELSRLEVRRLELESSFSTNLEIWKKNQEEVENEIGRIKTKLSDPDQKKILNGGAIKILKEKLGRLIHINEALIAILKDGVINPEEVISLQLDGADLPTDASQTLAEASESHAVTSKIEKLKKKIATIEPMIVEAEKLDASITGPTGDDKSDQRKIEKDLATLKYLQSIMSREGLESDALDVDAISQSVADTGEAIYSYKNFGNNSAGETFRSEKQIELASVAQKLDRYFKGAHSLAEDMLRNIEKVIMLREDGYLDDVTFGSMFALALEGAIYSNSDITLLSKIIVDHEIAIPVLTNRSAGRLLLALARTNTTTSFINLVFPDLKLPDNPSLNPLLRIILAMRGNMDVVNKLSREELMFVASYLANQGSIDILKNKDARKLSLEDKRQVIFFTIRTFLEENIAEANEATVNSYFDFINSSLAASGTNGHKRSFLQSIGIGRKGDDSFDSYCKERVDKYLSGLSRKEVLSEVEMKTVDVLIKDDAGADYSKEVVALKEKVARKRQEEKLEKETRDRILVVANYSFRRVARAVDDPRWAMSFDDVPTEIFVPTLVKIFEYADFTGSKRDEMYKSILLALWSRDDYSEIIYDSSIAPKVAHGLAILYKEAFYNKTDEFFIRHWKISETMLDLVFYDLYKDTSDASDGLFFESLMRSFKSTFPSIEIDFKLSRPYIIKKVFPYYISKGFSIMLKNMIEWLRITADDLFRDEHTSQIIKSIIISELASTIGSIKIGEMLKMLGNSCLRPFMQDFQIKKLLIERVILAFYLSSSGIEPYLSAMGYEAREHFFSDPKVIESVLGLARVPTGGQIDIGRIKSSIERGFPKSIFIADEKIMALVKSSLLGEVDWAENVAPEDIMEFFEIGDVMLKDETWQGEEFRERIIESIYRNLTSIRPGHVEMALAKLARFGLKGEILRRIVEKCFNGEYGDNRRFIKTLVHTMGQYPPAKEIMREPEIRDRVKRILGPIQKA